MSNTPFYGWRIVAACMALATVSWSMGIFGMGVYVYALTEIRGFSISTVSTAVTSAFVVSGLLMVSVGRMIARRGPRPVVAFGVVAMGTAVACMPYCQEPWQVYLTFLLLGLGMACLSTNTIGSTLAPWFERFQGRATSTALLGASMGGMVGTPLFLTGIRAWGFQTTAMAAALIALSIVLPLALFVLKRRPQDIGQFPDGIAATDQVQSAPLIKWSLKEAIVTRQFRSHVLAFGLGLMVQVGFVSHHVPIAVPVLGPEGAAATVFLTAVAAFLGRITLARYADQVSLRKVGSAMFLLAGVSLVSMALLPGKWALLATSISFGITVGNVTTLAPMVLRREFGAASFGIVFGLAATLNQLSIAVGPSVYGVMRDIFGSYQPALVLCGMLNIVAAWCIVWGGKRPLANRALAVG